MTVDTRDRVVARHRWPRVALAVLLILLAAVGIAGARSQWFGYGRPPPMVCADVLDSSDVRQSLATAFADLWQMAEQTHSLPDDPDAERAPVGRLLHRLRQRKEPHVLMCSADARPVLDHDAAPGTPTARSFGLFWDEMWPTVPTVRCERDGAVPRVETGLGEHACSVGDRQRIAGRTYVTWEIQIVGGGHKMTVRLSGADAPGPTSSRFDPVPNLWAAVENNTRCLAEVIAPHVDLAVTEHRCHSSAEDL
ncbi:MAG: hypothetical protein U0R77_06925 [Mycolicibacterium insubricum]